MRVAAEPAVLPLGHLRAHPRARWLAVVLGCALAGCWAGTPPPAAEPIAPLPIPAATPALREPRTIELGTFDPDGVLHPTSEIPHAAGTVFGWRMELGCAGELRVREELRLPAPGDWGPDPELTVSASGLLAQVQSTMRCQDGWIEKAWTLAPGDPLGVWVIRISPEGFEPQALRLTVVPPPTP